MHEMNGHGQGHDHTHAPRNDDAVQSGPGPRVGRLYVLARSSGRPFVKVLAVANDTVWYREYDGYPTVEGKAERGHFSMTIDGVDPGGADTIGIVRVSTEEFEKLEPQAIYVEASLGDEEWQATLAERFAALGTLTEEMRAQLDAIAPSRATGIERRPCTATLNDGTVIERVIVVEVVEAAAAWMLPASDEGPYGLAIDITNVASLTESDQRLPAELATRIYMGGETAKDQYEFVLVLNNGTEVGCKTAEVIDFPGLPAGVRSDDVADVRVFGRAEYSGDRQPADFRYCYYRA